MRVLMKVSIPAEAGSRAIAEGKLLELVTGFLDRAKPEAAYFLPEHGKRTAMFFLDLERPDQVPELAEPFFANLGASVEMTPAMNAEDVKAGIRKAMEKNR
ncbi:MAG TPA: hypothetical protein VKY73_00370 [Polyangiaceae bacterium]|nr:hypothetical protein [Polyangiaceae bacterium]